ncbi:MAG TPA: lysylphosphatidylglycerol synthase transmembrane domain-containing protein [Candidatus Paceibacterota bacterium]
MKRIFLGTAAFMGGVVLFGVLISYIGWHEVWASLQTLSFLSIAVLFTTTAVFLALGVFRWQYILKSQGYSLGFLQLWKSFLSGFSLLFFVPIIPFANEVFRGSVLRDKYNIPFSRGMASVVIEHILELTSTVVTVVAGGVIFLSMSNVSYSVKTFAVILFVTVWFAAASVLYIRIFQKKTIVGFLGRKKGNVQEVEQEVFAFFRLDNRYFWQGVSLSFLRNISALARVVAMLFFFGKGIALVPGITILGFYYLAILVPVPAALGSHDALQAAGFAVFGFGAGTGAAFALAIRAAEIAFAGAGLIYLVHHGVHMLGNFFVRK